MSALFPPLLSRDLNDETHKARLLPVILPECIHAISYNLVDTLIVAYFLILTVLNRLPSFTCMKQFLPLLIFKIFLLALFLVLFPPQKQQQQEILKICLSNGAILLCIIIQNLLHQRKEKEKESREL